MVRRALSRDFASRNSQIIVLLVLAAIASFLEKDFLTNANLSVIALQYSIIGLIALGQFSVMLLGGIDLSQGSIIAVASVVGALAAAPFGLMGVIVASLLSGAAVGLLNGFLVGFTRIPPFVVTLGMMGIVRGMALTITDSHPVPVEIAGFVMMARTRVFGVPGVFLLFLAVAAVLAAFLAFWPLGRHFYAVGGNEENTRLSGVSVVRVKFVAYCFSGLMSGAAGLIITSRMGTGHPLSGENYELESIAASIIGGASLFGGVGRVSGIVAGVLILGCVNSMINLSGASPYLHGTIKGVVVLLAVALSQIRFVLASRASASAAAKANTTLVPQN